VKEVQGRREVRERSATRRGNNNTVRGIQQSTSAVTNLFALWVSYAKRGFLSGF
jgi:hypothetical protein